MQPQLGIERGLGDAQGLRGARHVEAVGAQRRHDGLALRFAQTARGGGRYRAGVGAGVRAGGGALGGAPGQQAGVQLKRAAIFKRPEAR